MIFEESRFFVENTWNLYFRHMNKHENCIPDPFFILPELKNKQNGELLMFLFVFLHFFQKVTKLNFDQFKMCRKIRRIFLEGLGRAKPSNKVSFCHFNFHVFFLFSVFLPTPLVLGKNGC